jgi:alcohol dehydrogenase (cytochrome c)
MKTGRVLWNKKYAEAKEGYHSSGAPIVANGVLISGMAGGVSTTRGFLDGWNPDTGEKLWRRYTIPAPGEPGSETWPANSDAWKYGGGPTWRSGSYDPELDLDERFRSSNHIMRPCRVCRSMCERRDRG